MKIDKKIVGYRVVTSEKLPEDAPVPDFMHEGVSRPERLHGNTYKIKTPDSEHALYVTINNITLNEGTADERIVPYEMFINSKNMEHFQWVLALTRVVSAVFRKGGDVTFLASELKAVFDPKGGYFRKSKYIPSIVAELGNILEDHFTAYGLIVKEVDPHVEKFIAEKKAAIGATTEYPDYATVCPKCGEKAVIRMDNCNVCLACSDSKCG